MVDRRQLRRTIESARRDSDVGAAIVTLPWLVQVDRDLDELEALRAAKAQASAVTA